MSGYVVRDGKMVKAGSAEANAPARRPASSGGLTANQKMMFGLAAVLIGPSLLQQVYEKVTAENVDLSQFNMVTHYDKPAIEMLDDTLRIQYCASCNTNGQFRRTAVELQQTFPGLKIEGGPYTPPANVQYGIKAVRATQLAVGFFFIFGEQILASMGRPPFEFMGDFATNLGVHGGVFYLLNCVAQTMKSINAFEVFYNGEVLFSKLKGGGFPEPGAVPRKLKAVMDKKQQRTPVR